MGRKKNQESHFRRQNKRRENGGARIPLPFVRKQQQQQQQRKKKKGSKTIDGWHLLLASLFDPEDVALVPFLHLLVGRKSAFAALQLLDELGRRFAGLSTNRRKRKSVNRRTAASRLPIGRRSVQSEDRRFVSSSPFFFFFFLSPGHEFLFFSFVGSPTPSAVHQAAVFFIFLFVAMKNETEPSFLNQFTFDGYSWSG